VCERSGFTLFLGSLERSNRKRKEMFFFVSLSQFSLSQIVDFFSFQEREKASTFAYQKK